MQVELSEREVELITDGLSELHELTKLNAERTANHAESEKYSSELIEIGVLFDKLNISFD